jgi:hypothetical protein
MRHPYHFIILNLIILFKLFNTSRNHSLRSPKKPSAVIFLEAYFFPDAVPKETLMMDCAGKDMNSRELTFNRPLGRV